MKSARIRDYSGSERDQENVGEEDRTTTTTTTTTTIPVCETFIMRKSPLENTELCQKARLPRSLTVRDERPLVLAMHLVPSLPVEFFQVLAEVIECATGKAVVLLHESRGDRPVAKEIVDIAVLPASSEWKEGVLLPVSPAFKHCLNKDMSARVFVDVVLRADIAPCVQDLLDLRGRRCAFPDRDKRIGATTLLLDHLRIRGESPAFFGDMLDTDSQLAALRMIVKKQTEVSVVEAPVLNCYENFLPGAMESLHVLTSLGPLPPYRVMVSEKFAADPCVKTITDYLLNINTDKEWMDKFAPFGVLRFAHNSEDLYDLYNTKSVSTNVPYY